MTGSLLHRAGRALIVSAMCVMVLGILDASAQTPPAPAQPPRPATPPRTPAAPPAATPQQPPNPAQMQPKPLDGVTLGWVKVCQAVGSPPHQACVISEEVRDATGNFLASAAMQEVEGEPRRRMILTVPLGAWIPTDVAVRIDGGRPVSGPYGTCLVNGCFARIDVSNEMLQQMRRGETLFLSIRNQDFVPFDLKLPLESFLRAYDGASMDLRAAEDRQRAWEVQLQQRAAQLQRQQQLQQRQQQQPQQPAVAPPLPNAGPSQLSIPIPSLNQPPRVAPPATPAPAPATPQ